MDYMRKISIWSAEKTAVDDKKCYLFLRTAVWALIPLGVSLLTCLLSGIPAEQAGEAVFIISGYSAAAGGLGGGILKLYRE